MNSARSRLAIAITGTLLTGLVLSLPAAALAFIGPVAGQSAGSGGGALSVGSGGVLGVGTSTPNSATRFLIVASTTSDTGNYVLKVLDSSQNPLFIIRNDGSVGIGTASFANTGLGAVTIGGLLSSSQGFTGSLSAANVSAGEFGANTGNGSFAFPGNVGIGGAATFYQTLTVAGDLGVGNTASGAGVILIGSDSVGSVTGESENGGSYNNLELFTGPSPVMTLTTGGNVGIGTTNPGKALEVDGTINAINGSGDAAALSADSSGGHLWVNTSYSPSNPGANWVDDMTFTSSGGAVTFGGGVTAPTFSALSNGGIAGMSDANEDCTYHSCDRGAIGHGVNITTTGYQMASPYYGALMYYGNSDWIGFATLPLANNTTFTESQLENSYTRMAITDAGVGIGTISPAQTLSVNGNAYFNGNTEYFGSSPTGVYIGSINSGAVSPAPAMFLVDHTNGYSWELVNGFSAAGDFQINKAGTGPMFTLTSGGNVGIGTTNPASTLQVNGTANITGNLTVGGTFGGQALTGTLSAGNVSAGTFGNNTGGGNYEFSNYLGVGTTNTYGLADPMLAVDGYIAAANSAGTGLIYEDDDSGGVGRIAAYDASGSSLAFETNSSSGGTATAMTINSSQQVSIGTTAANGTLNVAYSGGTSNFGSTAGGNNIVWVNSSGGSMGMWAGGGMGLVSTGNIEFIPNQSYSSPNYSPAMTVTSGGGVGIDTTSPGGLLADTSTNFIGDDGNGEAGGSFTWSSNGNLGYAAAIAQTANAGNANGLLITAPNSIAMNRLLDVISEGTPRFYVTGVGNAYVGGNLTVAGGINTGGSWVPSSYANWAVNGTGAGGAAIYNDDGSYQALMIVGNNSAGGDRQVQLYDDLWIDKNLTVQNNATIGGTLSAGGYTGAVSAGNVSAGTFGSNTGYGNYIFGNNVGIDDNTNPANNLVVGPGGGTNLNFDGNQIWALNNGASSPLYLNYASTGSTIINQNGGSVGIGTGSPNQTLTVAGDVGVGNTASGAGVILTGSGSVGGITGESENAGSYNDLEFFAGTAPLMTLTTGDQVGFATVSPNPYYFMTINGSALANSFNVLGTGGVGNDFIGGDGDGASFSTVDGVIQSWYGIGFNSTCCGITGNDYSVVINPRSGNIYTQGAVGIGLDNPGSMLTVLSPDNGSEALLTVLPNNQTQSVNLAYNHVFEGGSNGNNPLFIDSQGASVLYLQDEGGTGGVVIGTSLTIGASLDVSGPDIVLAGAQGNGICFWSDCSNYTITMGNGSYYDYGPVTDYSIRNTMSNTAGRGWTWGADGVNPIAALSTAGTMAIAGHFKAGGGTPSLDLANNNCGTSGASITGTDSAGTVTVATNGTAGTFCTLTFATAFTSAPTCVVSVSSFPQNDEMVYVYSVTTSQLEVGADNDLTSGSIIFQSGEQFSYICEGT